MPILQGRLRGMSWIAGSSNHGCWLGSYEYDKRRVFEKTLTEGSVVLDIGAHVGFYTLLASVLVGPRGRVVAFEPVPSNVSYLKEHLRLNAIRNVRVMEAAVSDCCGVTSFEEAPSSSMGHISRQGTLQVKAVGLDELISAGEIPVPHYMKIDVEGAEIQVLSGAKTTLVKDHPTLFLSTHGPARHRECCELLHALGYELQSIGRTPVEQSSEILAYPRV